MEGAGPTGPVNGAAVVDGDLPNGTRSKRKRLDLDADEEGRRTDELRFAMPYCAPVALPCHQYCYARSTQENKNTPTTATAHLSYELIVYSDSVVASAPLPAIVRGLAIPDKTSSPRPAVSSCCQARLHSCHLSILPVAPLCRFSLSHPAPLLLHAVTLLSLHQYLSCRRMRPHPSRSCPTMAPSSRMHRRWNISATSSAL